MNQRPVVLSVTSNGVGMGHICRQLAVMLSGSKRFDSVVLSLSGALPRISELTRTGEFPEALQRDTRFEYSPSRLMGWHQRDGIRGALWRMVPGHRWESYISDRIVAAALEVGATDIIFDGVAAYDGVVDAIGRLDHVRSTWFRPCLWQEGVSTARLEAEAAFDRVIEPGDLAQAFDLGPTQNRPGIIKVGPVSLTSVIEINDRERAREALGLPFDGPIMLLAPGAGAVGSVDEIGTAVFDQVGLHAPEWKIAVTNQAIAQHSLGKASTSDSRVIVLDDVFPLARNLKAFDAAVSASGYNATNELMDLGIPTLFIPSLNHKTDDQPRRAYGLAQLGAALDVTDGGLEGSIVKLLDSQVREKLKTGCALLPKMNGAEQTAKLLSSTWEKQSSKGQVSLESIEEPNRSLIDFRRAARPGQSSFEIRESMSPQDFIDDLPIENIVAGSSEEYVQARERIARWLYR